ncbi:hypothetical protein RB653_005636 [Dictyostelium firmibasis]|uniref:EGF-like domain-containing protein n=1 Tax=Dictyostelium firmibasis TaxID=79012 RepID=A0AAN7YT48_9MYCE
MKNYILFHFLLVSISYAIKLNDKEYNCSVNLFTKLNLIGNVQQIGGYYDFCNTGRVSCNNDTAYYLNFGTNYAPISYSDISCYPNLNNLDFTGVILTPNIIGTPPQIGVTSFKINFYSCYDLGFYDVISLPTQQVHILNLIEPLKTNITLSSLSLIQNIEMYEYSNPYKTFLFPFIINDLKEYIPLNTMLLYVSNVPNFTFTNPSNIEITLGHGFDRSSLSNFDGLANLNRSYSITFKVLDGSIPFPFKKIKNCQSLTTTTYYDTPNDYIDISNIDSPSIRLSNVSSSFSVNGNFPLINFNSKTKQFKFSDGYLKSIPIIQNLNSLDLSGNKINLTLGKLSDYGSLTTFLLSKNNLTGTLDKSYCSLNSFDFSSNSLSGPIPLCFACFLPPSNLTSILKTKLIDNNFDSFFPPTSCNIVPNLKLSNNQYILYGDYVGTSYTTINSPGIAWTWRNYTYLTGILTTTTAPPFFDITYGGIGKSFILFASSIPPNVTSVQKQTSNCFQFIGSYFNYNISSTEIKIGDKVCNVQSTTFYEINCCIDYTFGSNETDLITTIKVGEQNSQITITPSQNNTVIPCKTVCDGICYTNNGTCIGCPSNCNNGQCDRSTFKCVCNANYIGSDCSIPLQYVTSIVPIVSNTEGIVQLFGLFGNVHDGLSVQIGGVNCNVSYIDNQTINCTLKGGSGLVSVNVTQNDIIWFKKNFFNYIVPIQNCPNNCNGDKSGTCDTTIGQCICNVGFVGINCSPIAQETVIPVSNSSVDLTTGFSYISNEQTNYEIKVIALLEVDINGNTIFTHPLVNSWSIDENESTKQGQYTFSQYLGNGDDKHCKLVTMIEEVSKDTQYSFANVNFLVTANSLKLTISINNYTYSSSLNSLQLQIESLVSILPSSTNNDKCNNNDESDTSIDTSGISTDSVMNYITIEKNNKIFTGRFINKLLSDGRSTFFSSEVVSRNNESLIMGLNLPHCTNCVIDPDFSVLVSSSFKTTSCNSSETNNWKIPVAVVVSVVGFSIIVVISIIIIKRNRTFIKIKLTSIKLTKK